MATYLVTQATGQQSGWVITHLLEAGSKVHAVVRDPTKTLPPILHQPGVTVFKGDSTDFESIYRAAQGCKGAYLNTFPIPGLEVQQAKTVVDACKKAGVEAMVGSTTFATGDKTLWDDEVTKESLLHDYYVSKAGVEDAVRGGGFKAYTIVRPSFIHMNYLLPAVDYNFPEFHITGELRHPANDGSRMPHIDESDVAKYVVAAFQHPEKFNGQELDLINESLTMEEVRDILEKVSGKKVKVVKRSPEETKDVISRVMGQRFPVWGNQKDFSKVIAGSKALVAKFGIPYTSLENSLRRERDRLLEAFPA